MSDVIISTPCGEIRGIDKGATAEYRGIRYAAAERWQMPKQVEHWDGIYDATAFGMCSYQRRAFEDDAECNPFYHHEFREGMTFEYSEDCLFLNIYAPKDAENCPVLVYIHGGSYTGGSSNEGHIDGTKYAENGIVFVSFNYRLGPFGFVAHPDLKDENGNILANFGLYDQHTALKWIKDNISAFGGDSGKITLMGQSAGAMSVDIHISSPMSEGWFSGAILMSGAGLQRAIRKVATVEKVGKFWDMIIANAGKTNINELRELDPKTLYYAWFKACNDDKVGGFVLTMPVADDRIIAGNKFSLRHTPDIPVILGITINDMLPVLIQLLIKSWGRHAKKDCFVYCFDRLLPGDDYGAWHSSDLLYAFGTLGNNWRPFEDADYAISNQMVKAFTAFAETGNPNCEELSGWKKGSRKIMSICENSGMSSWKTKTIIDNTINKGPF